MSDDKLRKIAVDVLADYMGIAAEFAVDDALDEANKNPAFAANADTKKMYFFGNYSAQFSALT